MARPRKCRICGYRFRDNEDICPECFTARDDDISCEQFGRDEHTHGSGMSTTEDSDVYDEYRERSFIDEQRSEEAKDPIPSSTYGGRQGTPPPTYAQQSYHSGPSQTGYSGSQTRRDKLEALRNAGRTAGGQTGYNPQNVFFGTGQQPGRNVYYTKNGQKQKTNSAVVAVIVIFFLVIFFVPFIMGIIASMDGSTNKARTTTTAKKYSFDISYEMPDISMPDISIPDISDFDARQASVMDNGYQLFARHITAGVFLPPEKVEDIFTEDELSTINLTKGYDPEGYRLLTMDLRSEPIDEDDPKNPDIAAFGCYVDTYDADGFNICTSFPIEDRKTGKDVDNAIFLIPADYKEFKLYVLVDPEVGDASHRVIEIKSYNVYQADDMEVPEQFGGSDADTSAEDKTA